MEDLVEVRKTRSTLTRFKNHSSPLIKMEYPRGQFIVFLPTANLLEVKDGSAIMFAFSKKENCSFVYSEEPESDSYYLSASRSYFRFTNKELMKYFIDFFGIEVKKAAYFEIDSVKNQKGMFKLLPLKTL